MTFILHVIYNSYKSTENCAVSPCLISGAMSDGREGRRSLNLRITRSMSSSRSRSRSSSRSGRRVHQFQQPQHTSTQESNDDGSSDKKSPRQIIHQTKRRLDRLNPLKRSVDALLGLVIRYEEETSKLKTKVLELEAEIREQKAEIREQKSKIDRIEARIEETVDAALKQKWNGKTCIILFYCMCNS